MALTVTAAPAPPTAREATPPGGPGHRWTLLPLIAAVLLVALPPGTLGDGPAGVPVADLVSGAAVLVCAGRLLLLRRRPLSPTAAAVLGLPVVGLAVATVTAADPVAALPGFVRYLQVFVLVPATVVLLLRNARDFRVLAGALVVLASIEGGVGVHQYVTGSGASYMGEEIRAVGTFGPGDVMGMATVVGYGLVAATAFALRGSPGATGRARLWAGATAALLAVPLTLSFSRGAWIATAAGAVAVIVLTGLRQAVRALAVTGAAAVVLVGGFGIGSDMIAQRLTSITEVTSAPDRSVNDRYTMWAAATGMWREQPATGVGLKGFPAHRDGHASIGLSSGSDTEGAGQEFRRQPLLSPHNMYLLVLSEQGLVGCVLLAGSWLALLAAGIRRLARARAGGSAALDCGLVAVGLMTWQTVDFLYADIGGPSTLLTGIVLGLAAWWALAAHEGATAG
ncbi:O-antigen ligase family protein [Streptomyces sp. NPDC059166]|uniref:O-antigen ligase family protein n=1 Tax=Streptomyces sp. NPDC059166 TaxID=3346752 RepID=UPI0036A920AB